MVYSMIFQKCIRPDIFSWIRHCVAEVCALQSALLVLILVSVDLSDGLDMYRFWNGTVHFPPSYDPGLVWLSPHTFDFFS